MATSRRPNIWGAVMALGFMRISRWGAPQSPMAFIKMLIHIVLPAPLGPRVIIPWRTRWVSYNWRKVDKLKHKQVNKIFNVRKIKLLLTETLEIDTIIGQKRGMFKSSLDQLRDADTIFKCRLPNLGNHLSLKSHCPSRLVFYPLFNIRERWRLRELKYLSRTCDLNMILTRHHCTGIPWDS